MADIHHDPSGRGLSGHTIAGCIVGTLIIGYLLVMAGQALGLFTL